MREFMFELLWAVTTAAVPVCTAFLVQFLHRKSAQIGVQTDSLTSKKVLDEVTAAVTTAVTYVSQTYVDGLKKCGNFTRENQQVALDLAVDQAKKLLTAEAKNFLGAAYGSLNNYLVSRAEAEVRRQKLEYPAAGTILESAEAVRESQDVTSVAAATAAATAAAVVQSAIPQAVQTQGADFTVDATVENTGGTDSHAESGETGI